MKAKTYILPAILLWILFAIPHGFAADKYYLLKKGAAAWDAGRLDEAIFSYEQYIDTHPATIEIYPESYRNRKQYHLRNLLIAYKNLLEIYRQTGDHATGNMRLDHLETLQSQGELGAKNRYQAGWILLKHERDDAAAAIFESIVAEQCRAYNPNHNKVLLRSCSKLVEIYQKKGESENKTRLLLTLGNHFPTQDFDPRDLYRLAILYINSGLNDEGKKLLDKIAAEDDFNPSSPYIHARMDAYGRLIELAHQKDKAALPASRPGSEVEKWIVHLSQHYTYENIPPNAAYRLALKYMNCDRTDEGVQLLEHLSKGHSKGAAGRKALFLLGRVAQSREKWDESIGYFETYINRYPDPPFFALKAYSNMIDAYWSKEGDLALAREDAGLLGDIVNQIADYETQLNLARDLKWKGMDQLAHATFSLGASEAEKQARKNAGTYKELQIHWLLTKYAQAIELFDIAEKNGKKALALARRLDPKNSGKFHDKRERAEYIESQIYLWMARIYETQGRYNEAEPMLRSFMHKFPDDKEVGYAGYALGQVLEKLGRSRDAADTYSAVSHGMWKEKARTRLQELSSDTRL
jgi:TolA-binding protein